MTSTWTMHWAPPPRTCWWASRPSTDVHLRTELAGYVTTSLALIVTKGDGTGGGDELRRWRGATLGLPAQG